MTTRMRLVLLLGCTAAGLAVGALGLWLAGNGTWFLAVPAAIALGWIFVADPTTCTTPPRRGGS